jgi:hypothetical protein
MILTKWLVSATKEYEKQLRVSKEQHGEVTKQVTVHLALHANANPL